MNTIETMTDAELSALLAKNVMNWRLTPVVNKWIADDGSMTNVDDWNPCQDYNHLRQVEERMHPLQWATYILVLLQREHAPENYEERKFLHVVCILKQMNARKRCECIVEAITS